MRHWIGDGCEQLPEGDPIRVEHGLAVVSSVRDDAFDMSSEQADKAWKEEQGLTREDELREALQLCADAGNLVAITTLKRLYGE